MLVRSCYVSQGMAGRKVSVSDSDLQGHSRALALVPFERPPTISWFLYLSDSWQGFSKKAVDWFLARGAMLVQYML